MVTLQGHWTYADWEALPDDGNRYEVIDGVLYMTTAPSFFHQWIVRRLDRYLGMPPRIWDWHSRPPLRLAS